MWKILGHTWTTKNNGATRTAKLNVARPKPASKVGAVGARRLVSLKKNKGRATKPKRENARVRPTHKNHARPNADGHGPLLYEEKMVCETSISRGKGAARIDKANKPICTPQPPPLHMHRRGNQVCCEGGRRRDYATHNNKQRDNHTRHEACIHTQATPICPCVHRCQHQYRGADKVHEDGVRVKEKHIAWYGKQHNKKGMGVRSRAWAMSGNHRRNEVLHYKDYR